MSAFLARDELQYLAARLYSADANSVKAALQKFDSQYRRSHRIASPQDRRYIEGALLGCLESYRKDSKIVYWCLIALGHVGSRDASRDAIIRAAQKHSGNLKLVAAAITALCGICKAFDVPKQLTDLAPPKVLTLGALQKIPARNLDMRHVQVDIENEEPQILELALVLMGLGKLNAEAIDADLDNNELARQLSRHSDPIVAKYSIWTATTNPTITLSAFGDRLNALNSQPTNIRSWLYQLIAQCSPESADYLQLISEGRADIEAEVRRGLSRGLNERYVDGIDEIVFDWITSEDDEITIRNLERHLVLHAPAIDSYEDFIVDWFNQQKEDSVSRKNMIAAAAGTKLYATFKQLELQRARDLFGDTPMSQTTINVNAPSNFSLNGDARNSGNIFQVESRADATELGMQLAAELSTSRLNEEEKREFREIVSTPDFGQKPGVNAAFLELARQVDAKVQVGVDHGEKWAKLISALVAGLKFLSGV